MLSSPSGILHHVVVISEKCQTKTGQRGFIGNGKQHRNAVLLMDNSVKRMAYHVVLVPLSYPFVLSSPTSTIVLYVCSLQLHFLSFWLPGFLHIDSEFLECVLSLKLLKYFHCINKYCTIPKICFVYVVHVYSTGELNIFAL